MRRLRSLYRARPRSDRAPAQAQEGRMTEETPAATVPPRKPRPGLGRGLSALLGDNIREEPLDGSAESAQHGIRMLPVSSLTPHPDQPRRHFDEEALDELAKSIKARGMIQP